MNSEEYRKLDEAVASIYQWYTKLGEANKIIKLIDFDRKESSHLALLSIASMVKKFQKYDLKINCSIRDYFYLWRKYHKSISFKRCRKDLNYPSCNAINTITEDNFYKGILEKIYEEYYKR